MAPPGDIRTQPATTEKTASGWTTRRDGSPVFKNLSVEDLVVVWLSVIVMLFFFAVFVLIVVRYYYKKQAVDTIENIHREFEANRNQSTQPGTKTVSNNDKDKHSRAGGTRVYNDLRGSKGAKLVQSFDYSHVKVKL